MPVKFRFRLHDVRLRRNLHQVGDMLSPPSFHSSTSPGSRSPQSRHGGAHDEAAEVTSQNGAIRRHDGDDASRAASIEVAKAHYEGEDDVDNTECIA